MVTFNGSVQIIQPKSSPNPISKHKYHGHYFGPNFTITKNPLVCGRGSSRNKPGPKVLQTIDEPNSYQKKIDLL